MRGKKAIVQRDKLCAAEGFVRWRVIVFGSTRRVEDTVTTKELWGMLVACDTSGGVDGRTHGNICQKCLSRRTSASKAQGGGRACGNKAETVKIVIGVC